MFFIHHAYCCYRVWFFVNVYSCTWIVLLVDSYNLSMSESVFIFVDVPLLDYKLLEEVKRVAESAQRMRNKLGIYAYFRLPRYLRSLKNAAGSRRTKLLFLPNGMSRREKNRSQYDQRYFHHFITSFCCIRRMAHASHFHVFCTFFITVSLFNFDLLVYTIYVIYKVDMRGSCYKVFIKLWWFLFNTLMPDGDVDYKNASFFDC